MLRRARIAVLVSGGGTNLEALLNAQESGAIPPGEFVVVVSNVAGAYALQRAANHGIPGVTVVKKGVPQNEFERQLSVVLREYGVDLIILAGFLSILGPTFIEAYRDRIINIHPSLIPSFCGDGFYGLKVHEAALEKGVKVTGATVHFVNEICDGGKIILQKAVYVEEGDTPEILQRRVMEQAEWELLPQATAMICAEIENNK